MNKRNHPDVSYLFLKLYWIFIGPHAFRHHLHQCIIDATTGRRVVTVTREETGVAHSGGAGHVAQFGCGYYARRERWRAGKTARGCCCARQSKTLYVHQAYGCRRWRRELCSRHSSTRSKATWSHESAVAVVVFWQKGTEKKNFNTYIQLRQMHINLTDAKNRNVHSRTDYLLTSLRVRTRYLYILHSDKIHTCQGTITWRGTTTSLKC